eukprot:2378307-Pleurochrysis_carterae.AAC.2
MQKRRNKNGMQNLTKRCRNNRVLNCEDTAVSRRSRPRSPSGGWRLSTKYRGYSGEQANQLGNSTPPTGNST